LVRERRELVQEVGQHREAQDAPAEFAAAQRLRAVESRLLALADTLPQVDAQEIAELRDQHVGLLHWLSQRWE
jgi:hypothetical protein